MEWHGVWASEAETHLATGCDEKGTTATGLIKAAYHFGFIKTRRMFLPAPASIVFDELNDELSDGGHPLIAFLKLLPSEDVAPHAVVLLSVDAPDEHQILVLDPLAPKPGERLMTRSRFLYEWNNANRTLILIER